MVTNITKAKDTSRLYSFVAFLHDDSSLQEVRSVLQTDVVTDIHVDKGGVDAAIAWLVKQEKSPQRLMVDISASARALDDLARLADACDPSVLVYVVGDRNDVGLYRNLLIRGVQDYLVKPLNADLVRRFLVQDKSGSIRQGRYGKCVVVMGTRGGVGVSTVAAHLARTLSQGGIRRRVVYVDLNTHDGCGPGILGRPGGTALIDVLNNISRLDHQYLERSLSEVSPDFYVLAAEMDYSDEFVPDADALRQLLDALTQYFHYVVVDVPVRAGVLAESALARAGLVCLLADPSVHSARTLVRQVRHIEARPSPPTVLPVLNHPWAPVRHQVQDEDFKNVSNHSIRAVIAYDSKGPSLAENLGQALPSHGEFSQGIQGLAALVTGESTVQQVLPWWRRISRGKNELRT